MSQVYVCRLCSNICIESESLCDTNGHYTEIYEITTRFFPPTFLDLDHGHRNHLAVLCLECWHHISEFHNFQQAVLSVQAKLHKDAEPSRGVVHVQAEIRTQDSNIIPIQSAAVKDEDEFVSLSEADVTNIESNNHLIVTECARQFEAHADSLEDSEIKNDAKISTDAILVGDGSEDEDNVVSSDDSFDEDFEEPIGVFIGGKFNEMDENSEIQNSTTSIPNATANCSESRSRTKRKPLQLDEYIAKWKPILKCEICSEPCSTYTLLETHFREKHPNDKCYTICCNRKFKTRYGIVEHIRFHLDPKTFKCTICKKCLSSANVLGRHMYCVHGLNSRDKKIYQRQKKHKCTICGKMYKYPSSLREHFTTHTGEPIHKCSYCPKSFTYRSSLCEHLTNAHPEKANKTYRTGIISGCSHCPKTFTYRTGLYHHLRACHPEEFAKRRTKKKQ